MKAGETRARVVAAVATVGLQALLGLALLIGLSVDVRPRVEAALRVFDVAAPKPPPRPLPPPKPAKRAAGKAAPPARRARATPIVAPPPVLRIERPPLVVAAPLPSIGMEVSAGAATAGPGSGAGGQGTGTGSGGAGDGTGGGTPAVWLRGQIRDSDYPQAAREGGMQGGLTTRYEIDARGRVTRCSIVKSSGTPLLDATTCRLAVERFRYRPARDATGRAVPDTLVETHRWIIEEPVAPPQ